MYIGDKSKLEDRAGNWLKMVLEESTGKAGQYNKRAMAITRESNDSLHQQAFTF
jgi:hypothetical protein